MLLVAKRVFGPKNLWIFFLCCFGTNCLAQVAGVALYLQYAPPGAPPPAPLAPPVPVTNFVPNSSFELGASRGWTAYGSLDTVRFGNLTSTAGRITNTNSSHGSNSIFWGTRLHSPPIYFTNGIYTLTFSAMAQGPALLVYWTNVSHLWEDAPTIPFSVGSTWARYTNTWVCPSNGYYGLKWYTIDKGALIDQVQMQPGSVATAYTPQTSVEFGLVVTQDINSVLMANDTKQFQIKLWNAATTNQSASVTYTVYDYLNTNLLTATFTTNALPPGLTTVNAALPVYTGWMRILAYQPGINDSWDEHIVAVLPYVASTALNTNGVIGSTPEYSAYSLKRDRKLGFTTSRDLTAACVRWGEIQPTSAPIVWTNPDNCVASFTTNGTLPLMVLLPGTATDGQWNPWATNAAGQVDINLYSNYCWTVANRYYPSNCIYWETGNEWHNFQVPTDFLNGTLGASNRARFMVAAAWAVSNATAGGAIIIGLAGENDPVRGLQTWNQMTAGEQTLFDIVSCHLYPLNQSTVNPNTPEDDIGSTPSSLGWKVHFGSLRPIWNTEMGSAGQRGGYLGPQSLAPWFFRTYGDAVPEAGRDWVGGQRKVVPVFRETRRLVRSLGVGFKKVINYTSKAAGEDTFNKDYNAGNMEWSGAPKQGTVAQLVSANHFIRNPGLGRITNTAVGVAIEAYLFTNELGTVVGIFSADYSERTLTTTDGRFGVYDVMSNLITTNQVSFRIGRVPVFLVSGSLTTAQLSNQVVTASSVNLNDTTGPNVSIDVSPTGFVPAGKTNFFKWTITDNNRQAWSIGPFSPDHLANTSRIKFSASDSYFSVGPSNHFWKAFTVGATNQLFVEGTDGSNQVSFAVGPTFISY